MKRVDLIKALESSGCTLERHGGKHDWYRNPITGVCQPVPRHREINQHLAKRILRLMKNPEPEPNAREAESDEPDSASG